MLRNDVRDFCGIRLCIVLRCYAKWATGIPVIYFKKQKVSNSLANYEPGGRRFDSFRDAFFGPESARTHIPEDDIEGDHLVEYSHEAPPVFLGHYWMEGEPAPLATNIACLDYSVAKSGGRLTAYRWDGEQVLEQDRFVWVERVEEEA